MRRAVVAAVAALVALGLFVPIAGLRVADVAGGLRLVGQPFVVLGLVGAVVLGVLAGRGWRARGAVKRRLGVTPGAGGGGLAGRVVAPALLAFAVLLPFFAGRYLLDLGVLVLTYVMLGWGLNIVVGLAGLLDLGYVAFYAVGAYSYALLSTWAGLGFWTCLPLSGLFACLFGVLLGFPVLRLRGDYLAIVTLAFGEIIRVVITNWSSLTGGPNGISGIARPTLFGLRFAAAGRGTFAHAVGIAFSPTQRLVYLYYIILGLALVTNFVTLRLRRLPLGRAWEALREDETACRSLGINVAVTKLTAFAIGATSGGFAGAFFATRQAFVSPESFTFIESATVLAIVVLGGLGSQLGVALAAIVMIGGLELLREGLSVMSLSSGLGWMQGVVGDFGQFRMLIFGLALVAVMVWRPRGLVTGRRASVSLGQARAVPAELVAQGRG